VLVVGVDRGFHLLRREHAAHAVEQLEQHAADRGAGAGFGDVGVRGAIEDHLVAVARPEQDPDQVALRARGEEDRGLLAEEVGGHRLEQVDGGVLAQHVVAHRRLGHEAPHLGRRPGRGVAAEVDQAGGLAHRVSLPPAMIASGLVERLS
jgi:hypothetical protein